MNEYDAIQKSQDATEFAESRFGQFFLAKLIEVRDAQQKTAQKHAGAGEFDLAAVDNVKAAENQSWLDWFETQKTITMKAKLRDKLRRNIDKRHKREKADE